MLKPLGYVVILFLWQPILAYCFWKFNVKPNDKIIWPIPLLFWKPSVGMIGMDWKDKYDY